MASLRRFDFAASWWHFGRDVTAATDDTFRRFYKLDNILATDVVDRVFHDKLLS